MRVLDNLAQLIGGGVSPFDPALKRHSFLQARVLLELRNPMTIERIDAEIDKQFDHDVETMDLRDEYLYGPLSEEEKKGREVDPLDLILAAQ